MYKRQVVDRLVQDEKLPFRYHFTPEDFYVFVVAHAYKHYSHGGTGIRTLADFYVMNRKLGKTLDWEYVESELRSLGILDYERDSRKLSQKLFGNTKTVLRPELTEEENQMFAYYLGATTYGNLFNQTLHRMQEFQPDGEPLTTKTKGKYIISRMFPNMEWCKCLIDRQMTAMIKFFTHQNQTFFQKHLRRRYALGMYRCFYQFLDLFQCKHFVHLSAVRLRVN